MRKNMFQMFALAVVISLVSCGGGSGGSGFESDVRKMAKYRCDMQKLMAQGAESPDVQKKLEALQKDMGEFAEKMEKKYADKKDDKEMDEKADKIMDEEMAKCK